MGTCFSLDISRAAFSAESFKLKQYNTIINTIGVLRTIIWSDTKMEVYGGVKGMSSCESFG